MADAATSAGHTPETFEDFLRGTPSISKLRRLEQELENIQAKKRAVANDATLELRNRETEIANEISSLKLEIAPEK